MRLLDYLIAGLIGKALLQDDFVYAIEKALSIHHYALEGLSFLSVSAKEFWAWASVAKAAELFEEGRVGTIVNGRVLIWNFQTMSKNFKTASTL